MDGQGKTNLLMTVTKSKEKGYPNPSKRSRAAFDWILENIVRTNVARFDLLFLHVQDPNTNDAEHEEALDMLEYSEFELKIGLVKFSWIAQGNDPKVVICNEVKRINAHLLVMGTRTRASFLRFFKNRGGEIACEYCLKNADCPVITVNNKAAQRQIALRELRHSRQCEAGEWMATQKK